MIVGVVAIRAILRLRALRLVSNTKNRKSNGKKCNTNTMPEGQRPHAAEHGEAQYITAWMSYVVEFQLHVLRPSASAQKCKAPKVTWLRRLSGMPRWYRYVYRYIYICICRYGETLLQSVVHTLSFMFAGIGIAQGVQTAPASSSTCVRVTAFIGTQISGRFPIAPVAAIRQRAEVQGTYGDMAAEVVRDASHVVVHVCRDWYCAGSADSASE